MDTLLCMWMRVDTNKIQVWCDNKECIERLNQADPNKTVNFQFRLFYLISFLKQWLMYFYIKTKTKLFWMCIKFKCASSTEQFKHAHYK